MMTTHRKSRLVAAAIGSLLALALIVVTSWSNSADGAVVASATKIKDPSGGIPFAAPDAALPAPWVSYKLSLHTTAGEELQAYQISISGPLHQRWIDLNSDSIFESTGVSTEQLSGDSHILAPPGALFGSGPTETNPGTGSPLASNGAALYGVGDLLQGAWATPTLATSIDIAYIVVPSGMERTLDIQVQTASPTCSGCFGTLVTKDFFASIVPEPGGAALLFVTVVGLLAVRSRRICR